ncbi:sodium:alanine symporter family protein [Synechococcus sp. A15-28]|jgi:AGCS family alanine or glycine:cation symporter|uniref:alanine/glycine:cation symporter family protein n=1 Tax=Synechococcus sp. A15-28 TaxID=1050638 RepID=UPI0016474E8A|nr:sodium:alanine symporter family protein [Synechococcus sp. A15-28]QNI41907.1 amino acid carrier family protein [Synechococcus sp. A15-28]
MGGLEAAIQAINDPINAVVWGWPTVGLIALTGVGLMLGLRFMPLQRLSYGIAMMLRPADLATDGDITPFQALMTSLSATIGTGNIAGVAGAIAVGGPGAVFWMWVIALFGIATKYAEAVLAVRFRETDASGQHVGGPMYYIVNGLGNGWAWMAVLFALFGMLAGFGIGNGVQAFEVSSALSLIGVPKLVTGIALGALVFAVVIGGIQRIAQAASSIVPLMSVLYVGACLVVLLLNAGAIPEAFVSIVRNAFTGEAAAGGALGQVILMGFKRGIFSNEAGLGSAPIAHAAAKTTDPVRQGTVAMLGTFIDTLIICTMTALVIITTGAHERLDGAGQRLSGADLSIAAFNSGLPGSGTVVTIGLVVFAFTTILGWSFYGERCTTFLFGENAVLPFRLVWVAVVVMGAVAGDRGVVWSIADTLNGLMALPNLVALLLLSGTVIKLTKAYRFSD